MRNSSRGFSLMELLIAVLIIGVLAAVAYPNYTAYVERTRIAETKGHMLDLASTLERYRAQNFSYRDATVQGLMPALANSSFYDVSLSVSGNPHQSYAIQAVPRGVMTGTGALVLNSRGESCFNKGNDSLCTPSATSSWDN